MESTGIGVGFGKIRLELGGFTGVLVSLMQTQLPVPFCKRLTRGTTRPQHQDNQPHGAGFLRALQKTPVMCINELFAKPVLESSHSERGMSILTGPPNIRHVCVSRAMNHRGLERSFI